MAQLPEKTRKRLKKRYLPKVVMEKKKTKRKPSQRAPQRRWSKVKGANEQIQSILSGKGRSKGQMRTSGKAARKRN